MIHSNEFKDGHDHGSMRSYLTGFALAVVLTVIPFWLVMGHVFESNAMTAALVIGFAFVQIIVHMVFFLHMNSRSEQGWIMLSLVFTVIIIIIALSGSLWVMYNLNVNMMPMSGHHMDGM